jgi:hypothetical protein
VPEYATILQAVLPAVFGSSAADPASASSSSSSLTAVELWDQLLVQPLSKLDTMPIVKPINSSGSDGEASSASDASATTPSRLVLLIDALDESTVRNGTSSELLDILSTGLNGLPSWLGVLVTSRPESYILQKLKKYQPIELTCKSEENLHDLQIYITHYLTPAVEPSQLTAAIKLLLEKCGGLILCARLMLQSHGLFPDDLPDDWLGREYATERLTLTE